MRDFDTSIVFLLGFLQFHCKVVLKSVLSTSANKTSRLSETCLSIISAMVWFRPFSSPLKVELGLEYSTSSPSHSELSCFFFRCQLHQNYFHLTRILDLLSTFRRLVLTECWEYLGITYTRFHYKYVEPTGVCVP